MKTKKKRYTVLASGKLLNGSILQELICEDYDPEKARARAKEKLDKEFRGSLMGLKMAAQFQPQSVQYTYHNVKGVELTDFNPDNIMPEEVPSICAPIAEEMNWPDGAYITFFGKKCVALPKDASKHSKENGIYGVDDYKADLTK